MPTKTFDRHLRSEEIYHITAGSGVVEVGGKEFAVCVGDTICTDPQTEHRIINTGTTDLKLLDVSSPPYQHSDTIITDKSITE